MPIPHETTYGPLPSLVAWLTSNGIDPCDVPIDADISIERKDTSGDRRIRYTALLRNASGHRYQDPSTGHAATEERTAPLKVEPPANVQVKGMQP